MTQTHLSMVSTDPLSVEAASTFVDAPQNGAATLFLGRVRNLNEGESVKAVTYDAHASMVCQVFDEIAHEARGQFGEYLRTYVAHFQGKLEVGGISVIIAVGSPHRNAAFKACRYIIEQLKVRAPIWKQEHYLHGDSAWLKGHSLIESA